MFHVPGYKITEIIHQGARSIVCRGMRIVDNLPVILKSLVSAAPRLEDLGRYRYAYNVTKSLGLEGVCLPYEFIESEQRPVLIMQDIGGRSLEQLLREKVTLSLDKMLELSVEWADTIGKIHQQQIIHKDIKPANFIVDRALERTQLIDFDLSSRLSKEVPLLWTPNKLQGTLAYISPEQTGRMNCAIDHRTDLYSLGVSLYQLMTGQLPFEENDPLALIHAHIALQVPVPHEVKEDLPLPLSQIIMKLMAKEPGARYQSAFGLREDLKRCLKELRQSNNISPFQLAEHDLSPTLQISQKLYGRDLEREELHELFEQVGSGQTKMLLLSGYSGIGKSSFVREIHPPLTRAHGRFISGKYNKLQNIPYAGLVQALRQLVRELLSEPEEALGHKKVSLQKVLGSSAQVMIDVLPELELLLGPQPIATTLPPMEAQNRFQLLFQRFVQFLTNEEPLVLFLDDLQWANHTTFSLLKRLLLDEQTHNLLVIGAYRDNEVDEFHPLTKACKELEEAGFPLQNVPLSPLSKQSVCELVSDSLHRKQQDVAPLVEILYAKTHGNPFFIDRFLSSLYTEGALWLDTEKHQWVWDLEKIQRLESTDNVVDLMTRQIRKVPDDSQQLLQLAACIGAQFDLQTLCAVAQKTDAELSDTLWPLVKQGLLIPLEGNYRYVGLVEKTGDDYDDAHLEVNYRFVHDRVQQAAYELVPENRRIQTHLKIGRHLLDNYRHEDTLQEHLFTVINQLNLGRTHIDDESERLRLAEFNLQAGKKAIDATAYTAAFEYLKTGMALLPKDIWEQDHKLAFELHQHKAASALMCGEYEIALQLMETTLSHAKSNTELVSTRELQMLLYPLLGDYGKAAEVGLKALALFGFEEPTDMDGWSAAATKEAEALAALLDSKEISALQDLPEMSDPELILELNILAGMAPIASVTPHLFPVLITRMVRLSIEHGNHLNSPVGYVFYGFLLCAMGELEKADAFGQLALSLNQKQGTAAIRAPLHHLYGCFVCHWRHPLDLAIQHTSEAVRLGLENGVFSNAGWAAMNIPWLFMARGKDLSHIYDQSSVYLALSRDTLKYDDAVSNFTLAQSIISYLMNGQEKTTAKTDEDEIFARLSHYPMCLFPLRTMKLQAACIMNDVEDALLQIELAKDLIPLAPGLSQQAEYVFYKSLVMTAQYDEADEPTRASFDTELQTNLEQLEKWAANAPANHLYKALLLKAEIAAIASQKLNKEDPQKSMQQRQQAEKLYEDAIESAQIHDILHGEGLCLERAARFYTNQKKSRMSLGYLTDARYAYLRWGANKKVRDMERRSPVLRPHRTNEDSLHSINSLDSVLRTTSESTSHNSDSQSNALDLISIHKATRAISSEIVLEDLLTRLMNIVLENAGAQYGCLLLYRNGLLLVEAQVDLETQSRSFLQSIPTRKAPISQSIVRYVTRSHKRVLLADASQNERFPNDPHIQQNQPKSILCVPITRRNKLIGILYLENKTVPHAFTEDRCALLDIISAQAAISLENADLYTNLENKVTERTLDLQQALSQLNEKHTQLQETQAQLIQAEKMGSLGTLVAGVAHELNNPANFTLNGAQNLTRRLEELKTFIFELAGEDADKEIIATFDEKFHPLFNNLKAINDGAERIRNIVGGLRAFSRLDEAEQKETQLGEGLQATIDLVQANFQDKVNFQHNLSVDPPLHCWPAQLNQVFMNLMINACQAIIKKQKGSDNPEPGLISIQTSIQQNQLSIQFQDNGTGMTQEIQDRIFDPFFTTRDVGEGTGLGLSISFGIIEKHHGHIHVQSIPELGTTFTVLLPLS